MRKLFALALLLVLLLSACNNSSAVQPTATGSSTGAATSAPTREPTTAPTVAPTSAPTAAPTEASTGAYESADCAFTPPDGYDVECGYLTVPEDRSGESDATIRLHVAVFASTGDDPAADPVIYLEGGPGGNALEVLELPLIFQERFAPFLEDRDLIIFDQRGTGLSEPALDCQELTDLTYDTLDDNLTLEEGRELSRAAFEACGQRLIDEGINLAAYNSAANAADLNDLRVALGYDQWNLLGISYGTRLALTTMRDYPAGLRSVVLDSSYPLQAALNVDTPSSAVRAFDALFEGCAADAECNAAFPELERVFYETVDQLNANPITDDVVNPLDGESYTVLLNGDSIIGLLFQALYSSDVIPLLPRAIYAANQETDYSLLMSLGLQGAINSDFISRGMFVSVQCSEELPFITPEELARADDNFPELRDVFDASSDADLCELWGTREPAAIENEPVSSDIPTLVLAGEYDPITPPSYGQTVAETLSNSYYFQFPGLGHGVSIDHPCATQITRDFLNDPSSEPDSSCIAEMSGPDFVVPGGELTLVEIESQQFGYRSLLPEGWEELAPGTYAESASAQIAIIQQAAPVPAEQLLGLLSAQFGLDSPPEPVGERQGQYLNWTLYELELQNSPADMALAEANGITYLVLLISTPLDRQLYVEQLYLPVLDAMQPN